MVELLLTVLALYQEGSRTKQIKVIPFRLMGMWRAAKRRGFADYNPHYGYGMTEEGAAYLETMGVVGKPFTVKVPRGTQTLTTL